MTGLWIYDPFQISNEASLTMLRGLLFWVSGNTLLAQRLPRFRFVQSAVRRFLPAETSGEAIAEATRLQRSQIGTIFTLLGEDTTDSQEALNVADHYCELLKEIDRQGFSFEISVKLTQLGVNLGKDFVSTNLETVLSLAEELDAFVWIDMEDSSYVDVTLDIYKSARFQHKNTGICVQAYLYRTADDLENLLHSNPAIRLVKGAYAEPKEIAFPHKSDVDNNYVKLSLRLLDVVAEGNARAAFATHDETILVKIRQEAEARNISPNEVEFQMLYGINRVEQERLAVEGYNMQVLISYGSAWFSWYMRRLAERPANLWFIIRKMISG
jgi:proline dehydrogenase